MHLRPRTKLAAQLKTVWRPVTMRGFYHTLVTKRPNYLANELTKYELPIWDENGFPADKVATRLYPHRPPEPESEE